MFGNFDSRPLDASESRSTGDASVHAAMGTWLESCDVLSPTGTHVRVLSAPLERLQQLTREDDPHAVYHLDEMLTCTCSKRWPCAHSTRDLDSILGHVLLRISAKPIL